MRLYGASCSIMVAVCGSSGSEAKSATTRAFSTTSNSYILLNICVERAFLSEVVRVDILSLTARRSVDLLVVPIKKR